MKYFIFLFSIVAWGSLGLIIGKGVAGTAYCTCRGEWNPAA